MLQRYDSIRPGQVWLDTNGKRIQAHGGSILVEGDTFYWYGENKEKTVPGSGIWHWGVRLYSSKDLYNWDDLGLIIPPVEDDPTSSLHPTASMDRPHIVRNPRTGQYVCWLKVMGEGHTQTETVLVSDALTGPYTIVREGLRPLGMNAGDFDLVVDPTDGKGYYYFERVHSELICADLSDDYTDVTGYYSTHFPNIRPPFVREAPAHFVRAGLHYLITSGTTGYVANQSEIASARTYHGPFSVLGDPHPGDATRTSYRSQVTSVFKHPGKQDLYIALADRWLPTMSAELAGKVALSISDPGRRDELAFTDAERAEVMATLMGSEVNTSIADYVWLPLRFDGDVPTLDWSDEWRIEDFEDARPADLQRTAVPPADVQPAGVPTTETPSDSTTTEGTRP